MLVSALLSGFLGQPAQAADEELVLAIQPILDREQTERAFRPLCDHLGKATGRACRLYTSPNFLAYWEAVRRGTDFNLALDAAHFTDFRAQRLGFEVLAKVPDTVSYTVVTRNTDLVFDHSELVGKRMATLGIPSVGATYLNALYSNPIRQPFPVEVPDAEAGIKALLAGRAFAAILPTPIIAQQMAAGAPISVVLTTDPIPHIALSAAPSLPPALRAQIRDAALSAHRTSDGQAMLRAIGFEKFDPADAGVYRGQAKKLEQYYGY
jgi:ABC-type phosphate/phosphonate transport system substrate-binding protein